MSLIESAMPTIDHLDQLVLLVQTRSGLYVRYSDGPGVDAAEASRDHESGLPLPGLSANRLDPPNWWTRPLIDWLSRQVCQYLHVADRSPSHQGWVLTGRPVNRGPDDEPLLIDIEPVAWLGEQLQAEALDWYQAHFDREDRGSS